MMIAQTINLGMIALGIMAKHNMQLLFHSSITEGELSSNSDADNTGATYPEASTARGLTKTNPGELRKSLRLLSPQSLSACSEDR